ncbi:MFS transporter [Micromonospora polyrhachis]|uniref:MFS family permease n=1 Tax=Micromonospora polyrhachis TaxID=1282883 RepID=A0A7W7WPF5_9ACTN|nr:MFS transporter [Micromonospora polyrhachis]MBB4958188.1 MFS family permease [Micromonospora polyrhachis]
MRLLRRNRDFRVLFLARCVSFAGDSISMIALLLHVADSTGQGLAVAALLLAGDFTPSLLAPIAGALADRFDRRRLMIVCELVQGAVVAMIALSLPALPLLLVLVATRAVAGQIFQPASRAAVPALVRRDELEEANATLGFGTNTADLGAPLLAAALFPFFGTTGVLLVDAASFLVSALLLTVLPKLPPSELETDSLWKGTRAGIGYIVTTPIVRVVAVGFCAVVFFTGVDDVALTVLATGVFDVPDSVAAVLLGAIGFGLAAGYALLTRLGRHVPTAALLIAGFGISSLGNLLTGAAAGLTWAIGAAFAMQAVRGLGIAAIDVGSNTMLQRTVPDGMQGRVFGNLYGAVGLAAALSYMLGGLLLDATSAPATLVVAGAGGLVATLLTALALRTSLRREPAASAEGGAAVADGAPTAGGAPVGRGISDAGAEHGGPDPAAGDMVLGRTGE